MIDFPKVIGFVPAYNSASFIHKTLEALADQDYPNFEIWICDDASQDDTPKVCREFCEKDPRFKFFRNEKNQGWWKTSMYYWAKAADESTYCFFQPHDDLARKNFIKAQVALLEQNPSAVLAIPGMENHYPDGKSTSSIHTDFCNSTVPFQRISTLVRWEDNWWSAVHGIHRSKYISKVQPVNYLRFGEKEFALDLIWLFKLAGWGPFVCCEEVLFDKYYSKKSLSGSWKYNFVNRSAVYLAMAEETFRLPVPLKDKFQILMSITDKSFDSLKRKLGLSK